MTDWLEFQPETENDGKRYAWRLVIRFDGDWQEYTLSNGRFELHLTDEMVGELAANALRAYHDRP